MSDDLEPDAPVEAEIMSRSFDFSVERSEVKGDGLTLEGYAAVFNQQTLIDSAREGTFLESIAPGAFKNTIRGRMPVLQFDHGSHPLIGSMPLGAIRSLKEDDNGLYVLATLSDNWLTKPVRDAISDGAITGMSFRFEKLRDLWDRSKKLHSRILQEVRLFECGPVVFPAYAQTTVGVRARQLANLLSDEAVRVDLARLLTFATPVDSDADSFTFEETPDTPPAVAPVGAHRKRVEQTLRRLAMAFPELKESA